MTSPPSFCSSCGAAASGRYCSNCGKPLARRAVSGVPLPWIVAAGAAAVAAVALLVRSGDSPAPAGGVDQSPVAAAGAPPNLSQTSPRERFDRLFNRIMTAAERGDSVEVAQFLPMARMAYLQLDTVNVDARYHKAMLDLQGSDLESALAQADTIATTIPGHLFAFLVREAEAARRGDSAGVRAAREAFLAAYDREIALERVEYAEHRAALERFRNR